MWMIVGLLVLMAVLYGLMIVNDNRGNEMWNYVCVIGYVVSGILLVVCIELEFLKMMPSWGKVLIVLAQLALFGAIIQYNRKSHA